jgi:hypothetical protein
VKWSANKTAPFVKPIDSLKVQKQYSDADYLSECFRYRKQSTAETLLFKNATVWTNEKEGIFEETDVLEEWKNFCYR